RRGGSSAVYPIFCLLVAARPRFASCASCGNSPSQTATPVARRATQPSVSSFLNETCGNVAASEFVPLFHAQRTDGSGKVLNSGARCGIFLRSTPRFHVLSEQSPLDDATWSHTPVSPKRHLVPEAQAGTVCRVTLANSAKATPNSRACPTKVGYGYMKG